MTLLFTVCPEHYPYPWEDKCYLFKTNNNFSYEVAAEICNESGGRLVVIRSQTEQTEIMANSNNSQFWTGCTDILKEGYWTCAGYDQSALFYQTNAEYAGFWSKYLSI